MPKEAMPTQSDHQLGPYLAEVARTKPLSRAEEKRLADLARSGDVNARNQLVSANLRFVVSVALQFQGQGLPIEDLIAHGNMGLIRAAEKFDPNLGNKFITYGVWWIRQAIQQALAKDTRTIKIPMNRAALLNQAKTLLSQKYQATEQQANLGEAAEDLDVTEDFLTETIQMSYRPLSLDATLDAEEGGQTLLDTITGDSGETIESAFEKQRLDEEISELLGMLPEREEQVVRKYFGLDEDEATLDKIGKHLGVSRERARQIKESAIGKLRRFSARSSVRERLLEVA